MEGEKEVNSEREDRKDKRNEENFHIVKTKTQNILLHLSTQPFSEQDLLFFSFLLTSIGINNCFDFINAWKTLGCYHLIKKFDVM